MQVIIKNKGDNMKTVIVMVMAALAATQLGACTGDKTDSADSATAAE